MGKRILVAAVLAGGLLGAQSAPAPAPARTGAQLATFRSELDGSNQPYALYVPKTYAAGKRYPLVVSLHSEESNHRIDLRRVLGANSRLGEPDTEDMRYFPPVADVEYIVACPFARGSMGYQGIAEQDVYDMLADVERRFSIDPDRVYLTGISMGGAGALWLALTRPDVWAAVAPLCPPAMSAAEPFAANALNLPVRLFHGEQDPITSPESSRAWQRMLVSAGVAADYIEYPNLRHDVWNLAYRDGALFHWFAKFRRNSSPDRVRLVTQSYRYSTSYWVRIDGLTPGAAASIDARRTKAGFQVETKGLDGFSLLGQTSGALATVTIDGAALRVKSTPTLSFRRAGGQWRAGLVPAQGKRRDMEGPISAVALGRQVYVYGTMAAGPEEQETRRQIAQTAATWSAQRAQVALRFPVKADSAVTPEELENSNLILFGTAETNSLVARFSPQLPLALSPGAADYGLLFIAPAGKHYVLVSSGLPWWTGADEAARPGGDLFAPRQYRLLSTFGDYILFKGSLGHVVAEGRFDRNWKVPADASATMVATGTVTVH